MYSCMLYVCVQIYSEHYNAAQNVRVSAIANQQIVRGNARSYVRCAI